MSVPEQINGGVKPAFTKEDVALFRKNILGLAWPLLVEMTLMSLLAIFSSVMVSRLGENALAAVGITEQPVLVSMLIFQSFNVGGTALAARFIGAGKPEEARRCTSQVMLCNFALGSVLAVTEFIFAQPIVVFMGAKPEYLADAVSYMRFAAIGMLFTALPSAVTSQLRAVGRTRLPMMYNTVANVVNIGLNAVLIYGVGPFPALGVTGAGIATLAAKVISCGIALYVIFVPSDLPIRLRPRDLLRIDLPIIGRIAKIGLPTTGEQVAMRVGLLVFTRLVTSLDTDNYAAHIIAMKIQNLSFNVSSSFGMASTALTGRYLGAEKPDFAERSVREARRMGLVVSITLALVFFFFGRALGFAFTDKPEILDLVGMCLKIMAFIMPMQTSNLICGGSLRGAGDTFWPFVATLVGIFAMRSGLASVLMGVFHMGLLGAWIAFALDQGSRSLVTYLRFERGKWKKVKV